MTPRRLIVRRCRQTSTQKLRQDVCCWRPAKDMHRHRVPIWLAAHEAGHAVARLVLDEGQTIRGPALKEIDMRRVADDLAQVRQDARVMSFAMQRGVQNQFIDSVRVDGRLDIIEIMAGPIAELRARRSGAISAMLFQQSFVQRVLAPDQHEGDLLAVKRHAEFMCYTETGLIDCWRESCNLVTVEWAGIRRVARVLADCEVMSGDAFEETWRAARSSPSMLAHRRKSTQSKDQ